MKKHWFHKTLSLIVAGVMVFSLVACGKQESKQSGEESKPVSQSGAAQSSQTTPSVEKETDEVLPGSIVYPLDTDVTLSFWGGAAFSSEYQSWTESPAHNNFIEAVGVDIDFQYVAAGADGNQVFNMMLADEELPNMIFKGINPAQGAEFIEDGVIYDLTEYLPKYAPDFWEYINRPEWERELRSIQTADGAIYMIPCMYESNYGPTYKGPIVRQDWLTECGLDVPVTLEDWEEMLTAFKDKYNAVFGCNIRHHFTYEGFASGTGALGFLGADYRVNDDGKVVLPQLEPEWKELMEVMNRWWEMGLIDADSLTMDNDIVRNKILNNEIGATFVPMSQMTNIINDAESENQDSEWVAVPYPRTAENVATSIVQSQACLTTGAGVVFSTSNTEEELAIGLQLWNYAFTEEGMRLMAFGIEGESYTVDAEGNIHWVDSIANADLGVDYESRKYSLLANSGVAGINPDRLVQLKNKEIVGEAPYIWTENTKAPSRYLPSIARTEDENNIYTTYHTPISTYIAEEALKFLTGSRSLDEYDDFVKTINEMGAQDLLKVQQAAYDRFMGK